MNQGVARNGALATNDRRRGYLMRTVSRWIGAISLVAAVLVALSGCGSAATPKDGASAVAGLKDPAVFRVLISNSAYAPMYDHVDGKLVGFEPDASRAVADLWGVKVQYVEVKFDGLLPALGAGRADCVWSTLYLSDERLQAADAVTYMQTGPGLIVTEANPQGIETAKDLSGKTVACQIASANETVLKDLNEQLVADGKEPCVIQSYPDLPQTVAAVQNGKADALIETDVAVANIVAKTQSTTPLKAVAGAFPPSTKFAIYFPKGSQLGDSLRAALTQLAHDGTLQALAVKWGLDPAKITVQ
jgi:polar amino acid transport system substrate-binding protein